ncbi:hypothetical protein IWW56_004657 [Coemansia sp. RSA 2131]|nr:hypothetical protein IWW56_004657 [Coemansia sp. RSA 2131]
MSSSESDSSPRHTPEPNTQFPDSVQLLRSCESCRRKKRKCSGDRPSCSRCTAQGEQCTYRPTARFLKPRSNLVAARKTHAKKKRASFDGVRPRAMSVLSEQMVTALAPADLVLSPPMSVTPAGLSPGSSSDALNSPSTDVTGLSYMGVFPNRSTASPRMLMADLAPQFMYPHSAVPQLCDGADYSQLLASAITQQQATALMTTMPVQPIMPMASMPDPSFVPMSWPDPNLLSTMYPLPVPDSRPNLDTILPLSKNIFSEWFVQ